MLVCTVRLLLLIVVENCTRTNRMVGNNINDGNCIEEFLGCRGMLAEQWNTLPITCNGRKKTMNENVFTLCSILLPVL